MSAGRTAFGIAAFLPAIGIFAIAGVFASRPEVERAIERLDVKALTALPTSALVMAAVVILATVFVQIALGAAAAIMLAPRKDVSSTAKVVWPLSVMFVGSVAAPLCYFMAIRKRY